MQNKRDLVAETSPREPAWDALLLRPVFVGLKQAQAIP